MHRFFPFRRRRNDADDLTAAAGESPTLSIAAAPSLTDTLTTMRDALAAYFPPDPGAGLTTDLSLVSVIERSVGLGNWRGNDSRAGFAVTALKGGRLEALVRFQATADDAATVDQAIDNLHAALLAATDELWAARFLHLSLQETSLAESIPPASWRKTATYRVLYEYHYQDTDGAQSLIVRIPVHTDPEVRHSPQRETSTVTGEIVRWDNEASPPPPLVLRKPRSLGGLGLLSFIPGPTPAGRVTITRTVDGAAGPPTTYPTLAAFLTDVAGPTPTAHHAQITVDPFADFLAAFTPTGPPLDLGDWDEDSTPDSYQPALLPFDPPIILPRPGDQLRVTYQRTGEAPFDQPAVVYLRGV